MAHLAKIRVFSLAKELGLQTEALMAALAKLGVENITKASAIDEETAQAVREIIQEQLAKARAAEEIKTTAEKEAVEATEAPEAASVMAEEGAEAEVTATAAAAPAPAAPEAPIAPPPPSAPARPSRRKTAAPEKTAPAPQPEAPATPTTEAERRAYEREERERKEGRLPGGPPRLHEGLMALEEHLAVLEAQAEEEEAKPLVKPLPEIARRPTGPRPPGAVEVPPVVTVLGHIDHGKTTLLDALRHTQVAAREAGGITQHIGASEIVHEGKPIVFLDTPGHAAFTAMRARGAQVTDIAVIIVAADDGVMPQTVEAINHAKAANVPLIVAINKIDLPDANVERVKQQLLEHELVPEEWGGNTIVVPISAKTGENLDELLEMILLVAELQELWADPQADFAGVIVEARLDQSQGPVATVLVRNGRLSVGDVVVCGGTYGRIRRLRDWQGKSLKVVEPGHPAEVMGLSGVPEPGDVMIRVENLKQAREIAEQYAEEQRQRQLIGAKGAALRELYHSLQSGELKELNVIIKADAYGSVQAIENALHELNEELSEVRIQIIHSGVGAISESDVLLGKASAAIVVGFQVEADPAAVQTAASEGVEIRTYQIIYELLDDFRAAVQGMLEPIVETRYLGKAEVLQLFRVARVGVVAGVRVLDGELRANADIVVWRDGEEVFRGKLTSLKRFDQDVPSVPAGTECGVGVEGFRGWKVGDIIEATSQVIVERKLQATS